MVGVGSAGDVTISPFVWCYQAEYAVRTSHESLGGDRQEIPAGFQSALPPKRSSAGWFTRAVKAAKVQAITPHDLRHTCASLAVSAGANVLALARMLGHKDPSVTLRVYADLFDDDLDAVAVTLHTRYSRSSLSKVWARAASERPVAVQRKRFYHCGFTRNSEFWRVRAEGFEPSRSSEHRHLKPACLPFHHARKPHERTAHVVDESVGGPSRDSTNSSDRRRNGPRQRPRSTV